MAQRCLAARAFDAWVRDCARVCASEKCESCLGLCLSKRVVLCPFCLACVLRREVDDMEIDMISHRGREGMVDLGDRWVPKK